MLEKAVSILRLVLFFLCSYLITFASVLFGLIGQYVYYLAFDSFGRREKRARRKIKPIPKKHDNEYHVIVIGTGFSGLGLAIKMNRLGLDDYILIERHDHVGGTWYANRYPGCACDVPSNLYSFSFEPNPNWSYFFGRRKEIWDYLEHCADKYGIRRHIRFNTTVVQLKWLEERLQWQVTTQTNEGEKIFFARIVMAATGPLSNASYPTDIEGIDKFQGQMCHTSKWDETIQFTNKRVAVIGTGASAIQVVPAVQKMGVEKLYVFQRTAPWTIPRVDRPVTNFEKNLLAKFPFIQKLIRNCLYWSREVFVLGFAYRLPIRFVNEELVRHNLNREVKNEELRKKVTPKFDLGCKRVLVTSDWYPALQKPNVQLVTNRIKEIKSNSIVTYDDDEYPVDIIIWSTGFQTQKFGIPVYGTNGRSLAEQWSDTTQAYRGMTVPNFPNFFLLLGPNSRLGHSSVLTMLEAQLKYLVEALISMDENNLRYLSIKQNIHDEYNQSIQSKLKKSVWHLGGCHSWYQNEQGEVTTIWPDFTWVYYLLMRNFDLQNYDKK